MSDALARLASRALGLTGTVRPRAVSRFSDGGIDQPLFAHSEEVLVEPRLATSTPVAPTTPSVDAPLERSRAVPEPVTGPQSAFGVQARARREPSAVEPAPLVSSVNVQREVASEIAMRKTLVPEAVRERQTAARLVPGPESSFSAEPTHAARAPSESRSTPYEPLMPPRPRDAADPSPTVSARVEQSPTSAQPDIQISIGRIEVRAERPEPHRQPVPPPKARPSMMSLEDYLSRGRR
jgi:hypothetical protein